LTDDEAATASDAEAPAGIRLTGPSSFLATSVRGNAST